MKYTLTRKKIATKLILECPDDGIVDHNTIAAAVNRRDSKDKILAMPEVSRWPETCEWLKEVL